MEVIYKKSIFEKLDEVIKEAEGHSKSIDVIKLNSSEARDLYRQRLECFWCVSDSNLFSQSPLTMSFDEFIRDMKDGAFLYQNVRLIADL